MDSFPLIMIYILVFLARVTDMSLDVIRILMLTRGKNFLAASIGFVEITIFILALGQVFTKGFDNPFMIMAYAAGFAAGNYVGGIIEEKMAIGYIGLQIFPSIDCQAELVNQLRDAGFGATCVTGQGRSGERNIVFVFLKRRNLQRALNLIKNIDPQIFFNISDARQIYGGFFTGRKLAK